MVHEAFHNKYKQNHSFEKSQILRSYQINFIFCYHTSNVKIVNNDGSTYQFHTLKMEPMACDIKFLAFQATSNQILPLYPVLISSQLCYLPHFTIRWSSCKTFSVDLDLISVYALNQRLHKFLGMGSWYWSMLRWSLKG